MRLNRRWLIAGLLVPTVLSAEPLDDAKQQLKNRKYADAIAQLEPLTKTDATGEAAYCLAIAYDLSGDAAKAIDAYKKVVDGKGRRASDAEKSMKSLEAGIAATTAVDRARVDFQRSGLESSTRLKEAHERVDKATIAHAQRELAAQQVIKDLDAAVAAADEAERIRRVADRVLADWKTAGLAAPEDHGAGRRHLGAALFVLGGIGAGASIWYARTAMVATDEIEKFTLSHSNRWTDELEHYSIWGPTSDERLPYTLVLGGGILALGAVTLGLGEAAIQEASNHAEITTSVEGTP